MPAPPCCSTPCPRKPTTPPWITTANAAFQEFGGNFDGIGDPGTPTPVRVRNRSTNTATVTTEPSPPRSSPISAFGLDDMDAAQLPQPQSTPQRLPSPSPDHMCWLRQEDRYDLFEWQDRKRPQYVNPQDVLLDIRSDVGAMEAVVAAAEPGPWNITPQNQRFVLLYHASTATLTLWPCNQSFNVPRNLCTLTLLEHPVLGRRMLFHFMSAHEHASEGNGRRISCERCTAAGLEEVARVAALVRQRGLRGNVGEIYSLEALSVDVGEGNRW